MDGTVVKAALSGRELARQRRQALAQQGRMALAQRAAVLRPTAAVTMPAAEPSGPLAGCGCGCGAANTCSCRASGRTPVAPPTDGVARMLAAVGTSGSGTGMASTAARDVVAVDERPRVTLPTGRALAAARRAALAREGKAGLTRVAQATRLATTMPDRDDWREALQKGATGRQLAMQRRTLLALTGRAGLAASTQSASAVRPTGRVRPAAALRAAGHTEVGHTLSGQPVTGTQVERSSKVTGMEAGTCREVTGTEYIGQEQFEAWCKSRPQPQSPKVVQTHTENARPVTGAHPGLNPKVTGNETGACRGITGTRYLAAEDIALCESVQRRVPPKVSVMTSRGDHAVTGTSVGRNGKVTGNEAGSERAITGTQYALSAQALTGLRAGTATRRAGVSAAGASVALPQTEALGATQHGVAPAAQMAQRAPAGFALAEVSGDTPGTGGGTITGDERGACEPVTGTPYVGPDNLHGGCTVSGRWLTRYPELAQTDAVPPPQDFSVRPPARQAQERRLRITGSGGADDASQRVTGPGMKAQGLITGTPEFRHGGCATSAPWQGAVAPVGPAAAQRVSGEGAASRSVRITGDAWGSERRVTGTEGTSAVVRNPTQRGLPRPMGAQARHWQAVEREDVPLSPITGSSGNTTRGAVVTVSGGARG